MAQISVCGAAAPSRTQFWTLPPPTPPRPVQMGAALRAGMGELLQGGYVLSVCGKRSSDLLKSHNWT